MSPYTAQLTLPRLGESKRCASFYDLQARSFRAEKLTLPDTHVTSSSASAPETLVVQPGSLFVSNTSAANITAQVNRSGSGTLPSATWGDATGSGEGWQGSIAASNFVYTGSWVPLSGAPALAASTSGQYTGTADGDIYTVTVTSFASPTVDFSYTSTNGASGTGSATTGTSTSVGSNGLSITFSASSTYASGDAY